MPFVLDCSVAVAWFFPDEANTDTERLRDALVGDYAVVPSLWPIEIANVLLVAVRHQRIKKTEQPRILSALSALPIEIDVTSHERAWDAALSLAEQCKLSAYDAIYLELAVRRNLPLATLDRSLQRACRRANVRCEISV